MKGLRALHAAAGLVLSTASAVSRLGAAHTRELTPAHLLLSNLTSAESSDDFLGHNSSSRPLINRRSPAGGSATHWSGNSTRVFEMSPMCHGIGGPWTGPRLSYGRMAVNTDAALRKDSIPVHVGLCGYASCPRSKWLLVSKRRKVAFIWIPKVMCTTMRTEVFREKDEVRTHPDLLDKFDLNQYLRVAMIRHPFDRALSAYRNSAFNEWIYAPGCESSEQCTFEEWVDSLGRRDKDGTLGVYSNEHLVPEIELLGLHQMQYDIILLYELKADHTCFFQGIMGMDHEPAVTNESPTRFVGNADSAKLTPSIEAKLTKLYDADLKLWKRLYAERTYAEMTPTASPPISTTSHQSTILTACIIVVSLAGLAGLVMCRRAYKQKHTG